LVFYDRVESHGGQELLTVGEAAGGEALQRRT
jgi:hypothetical protein